jgi:hypothetical protein
MKAFPYAASLAKKFGASVFACHIIYFNSAGERGAAICALFL